MQNENTATRERFIIFQSIKRFGGERATRTMIRRPKIEMTFDHTVCSEGIGLCPLAHFIFRSVRIKFHPQGDNVGKCIRISRFDGMGNFLVTSDRMINMEKYGQSNSRDMFANASHSVISCRTSSFARCADLFEYTTVNGYIINNFNNNLY